MKPRRVRARVALCGGWLLASLTAAPAAVTMDGTTGAAGAVGKVGNDYGISSSLGIIKGANLFLSFGEFNLVSGESATFSGPNSIGNIMARVTGGPSSIDGKIASTISGANLYLINPQGIVFGPNASLDVSGSFTASTADYMILGTGGRFDARDPSADVLTSEPISAWGFLPASGGPANIDVGDGSLPVSFSVPASKTLSFVGGTVSFNQATLTAPGGRVEVNAYPNPGEYSVDATKVKPAALKAKFAGTGAVNFQDSTVDLGGSQGGSLQVTGASMTLQRTSITSETTGLGLGGDFDVRLSGTLKATGDISAPAQLLTKTSGGGQAGKVTIRAGKLQIEGSGTRVGSMATGTASSTARAGRVAVTASEVAISKQALLLSNTDGEGRSDLVSVTTKKLAIVGDASSAPAGIFSNSTLETANGTGGDAGGVRVRADSVLLRDGGLMGSSAVGLGNGGDVVVTAKVIDISAPHVKSTGSLVSTAAATGIFADTGSFNAPQQPSGLGGDVSVSADRIRITNGGLISTKTVGLGKAGNTSVYAGTLEIARGPSGFYTGIAVDSPLAGSGPGGDAKVVAGTIRIMDGGQISANTNGTGAGGSVTIRAKDVLLDGNGREDIVTGILAESDSTTKGGPGGSITIISDSLEILKGARVSTTTFGTGKAGNIAVRTERLDIAAIVPTQFTGIISSTVSPDPGAGVSGKVVVEAGTVKMTQSGGISATTLGAGDGGSVILTADSLFLDSLASIEASSTGMGNGSITTQAFVKGSQTVATVPDSGAGDAGSVTIAVKQPLIMRGFSSIRTTSAVSSAGLINITSGSDIDIGTSASVTVTASKGNAGAITLFAPGLIFLHDLGAVLAEAGLNGGNVSLLSQFGVLDHSRISANAILGAGGNILIIGDSFLPSASPVTASSQASVQGSVVIQSPDAQLANALTPLPEGLIGANVRLSERCALRLGADFSSFLVVGRGGVSIVPDLQRP